MKQQISKIAEPNIGEFSKLPNEIMHLILLNFIPNCFDNFIHVLPLLRLSETGKSVNILVNNLVGNSIAAIKLYNKNQSTINEDRFKQAFQEKYPAITIEDWLLKIAKTPGSMLETQENFERVNRCTNIIEDAKKSKTFDLKEPYSPTMKKAGMLSLSIALSVGGTCVVAYFLEKSGIKLTAGFIGALCGLFVLLAITLFVSFCSCGASRIELAQEEYQALLTGPNLFKTYGTTETNNDLNSHKMGDDVSIEFNEIAISP